MPAKNRFLVIALAALGLAGLAFGQARTRVHSRDERFEVTALAAANP